MEEYVRLYVVHLTSFSGGTPLTYDLPRRILSDEDICELALLDSHVWYEDQYDDPKYLKYNRLIHREWRAYRTRCYGRVYVILSTDYRSLDPSKWCDSYTTSKLDPKHGGFAVSLGGKGDEKSLKDPVSDDQVIRVFRFVSEV